MAGEDTLDDRLAALVGQPIGDSGPSHGPDPVNQPMIRHWSAAFEDWNPVYTDPDAAGRSRFGEIVAPPLMLQTWTMATPRITGMAERGGSPTEGGRATGARSARRARASSARSRRTRSSRSCATCASATR